METNRFPDNFELWPQVEGSIQGYQITFEVGTRSIVTFSNEPTFHLMLQCRDLFCYHVHVPLLGEFYVWGEINGQQKALCARLVK